MPAIAIVGAQWGDEGKGKIVDQLSEKADLVVRYSGGDNAGHTVSNSWGEFKLHIMPSGIFYPHTSCIIGNGVAINPLVLLNEMEDLRSRGIDATGRLFISDRAHCIMPYHLLLDGLEEERRAGKAIGTTRKGIGPAFSDKTARLGIRMGDLLDRDFFHSRLEAMLEQKNAILTCIYGKKPLKLEDVFQQYIKYAERLAPFITDTSSIIFDALDNEKMVLLEGAQGALLDTDFGTYPFVTSSSPLSAGACLGSGISPMALKRIFGIFKAYCTRVGSGPMPTELFDATGDTIRDIGQEYGTTTGRPRRCGWFDAVAARFSVRINGITGMVMTRLDVLDTLPSIKICTGYELDGKRIGNFPGSTTMLERCKPVYEELPGWQTATSAIRNYKELPEAARTYLERLETLTGCPVDVVSVGPHREETIIKNPV